MAEASLPEWTGRFERCQLELWLAQDRLRAAVQWADHVLHDAELDEQSVTDATQLALTRVLVVSGDGPSIARALTRLSRLLREAHVAGRMGVEIEALALRALACWQLGDRPAAMSSLEHALRLAEPEAYVRLFVDLGRPMARLLHEARARAVLPEYVDTLLTAATGDYATPTPPQAALPDPLTLREQEVLQRLAAGLTNREIAADLSISQETVKKHTGNIYSKLAVQDRRAAVVRARALALLG
jgi:ATP/maltotriose-dependent transcriptional regulator MalT